MMNSRVCKSADVLALLPPEAHPGERYAEPFTHGSMRLGMYAPRGYDPQSPHDQDELYFVLSGSGVLVHDDQRSRFKAGDALFVAAGIEHRFEDFSDDFATWVVFWGPKGGEDP